MNDQKIRVCIVDDEPLARKRIEKLLSKDSEVVITKTCANGQEAIEYLKSEDIHILFLDIQMPKLSGFDVLNQVKLKNVPAIIFTTAFDEYAVQAFEYSAIDYLLKPFDNKRFEQALAKAKHRVMHAHTDEFTKRLEKLLNQMESGKKYLKRIMIRASDRVYFINVENIEYIEAEGNYVGIHANGKKHLLRETMTNMEKRLHPEHFVRIHRSMIININEIAELQPWFHGDHLVILRSGQKVTMSRNYKKNLQSLLE